MLSDQDREAVAPQLQHISPAPPVEKTSFPRLISAPLAGRSKAHLKPEKLKPQDSAVPDEPRETIMKKTKFCFACGEEIDSRAEICPDCGVRQQDVGGNQPGYVAESPESAEGGRKRINSALLAFFLGGLGIHKFYLGYTTSGIIMLLVSVVSCGILALPIGGIALAEGIIYLTKSNEQFYEEYILNKKEWF